MVTKEERKRMVWRQFGKQKYEEISKFLFWFIAIGLFVSLLSGALYSWSSLACENGWLTATEFNGTCDYEEITMVAVASLFILIMIIAAMIGLILTVRNWLKKNWKQAEEKVTAELKKQRNKK